MKSLKLFAIALSLTLNAFCQDKGFVAINIGPSIPIGDFASGDENKEKAGFAKTGFFADLSFGYKLGNIFGIGATVRTQSNSYDSQSIEDILNLVDPSIMTKITADPWKCSGLLAGLYGSVPIKEGKTTFDFRSQIGFMDCRTPAITMSLSAFGFSESFSMGSSSSTSFAYLLGAGFKFDVSSKICINTGIDYVGTSPEFKIQDFDTGETTTYSQPISTINIGVGAGIRL